MSSRTGTGNAACGPKNYAAKDETTYRSLDEKVKVQVPYPSELAWLLIRHNDELEDDELQLVNMLLQDTKLAELRQLALKFIHIVRDGLSEQWSSWVERSCESTIKELRNLAAGLKKDMAAVYEAIEQSWSNGPTEGHGNRLKFLKRQMYSRASFDLLRLRVLLVN